MVSAHSDAARLLGARVRESRLRLGLSQEDVADLAEIHVTNLGKIERGQANPSLTTIVRVAGVLDVDPGDLVRGIGLDHLPPRSHRLTAADLIRERKARS
ncbi:helix-turn-helix domain-containing protein [Luethyella okanaganae]|uniref:Helix-turn-helix domain-containing protein n=1 Tax=Luethyella okanaganae TaxID=69372 RepID=A0ABW1VD84_9MICO